MAKSYLLSVHDGNHVHLFVSAPPIVCVPEIVRVFKCVSAQLLFEEFPELKLKLCVGIYGRNSMQFGTSGLGTIAKIEEYVNWD